MKPGRFTLQTKNYPVFLFSVINTIFQSCRESPLFMVPIMITVFIWSNISKEVGRRSNQSIDKALSARNIHNPASLLFLLLSDCISKSVIYWIRPLFETKISKIIELNLFGEYLKLDFEKFYENGPALNSAILFRHVSKIAQISTVVLFDVFDSVAGVISSLRFLYTSLGNLNFMKFVISLMLICAVEAYFFSKLSKLKRECVEIDDARAEDMTECFENILISESVDEKDRMNRFFVSNALLKYSITFRSIKITRQLAMFVVMWYVLSNNEFRNTISLIRELNNASNSVKKFVNLFFELESSRIELEDQKIFKTQLEDSRNIENAVSSLDDSVLKTNGVSIFIKDKMILRNISLCIKKGDRIVLYGKNGSGKSTFFKFLLGFLRYSGEFKSSGNIDFSYIPQNTFLNGTIYEELAEFCKCNEEIFKTCRMFNFYETILSLKKGFETDTGDLSESQRQIIKVIQGVLKPSKVILVDEPTTGLDDALGEKVLDLILESHKHTVKIVILHEKKYLSRFDKVFLFENQNIKVLESSDISKLIK